MRELIQKGQSRVRKDNNDSDLTGLDVADVDAVVVVNGSEMWQDSPGPWTNQDV